MQKCDAVAAESDGTVPKNARCCTGREVDINRNAVHSFSLLQNKLRVTGWRILLAVKKNPKGTSIKLEQRYVQFVSNALRNL